MEQAPTLQELINIVKRVRTNWESLVQQIDQEKMTQPGVAGEWSLKDIIAHLTWHEREMVGLIEAHALVGSELWNLPTDERNVAIYEEFKELPLEQVLKESNQAYKQLIEVLPSLSDQDLTNPDSFPNMPPDWQPWTIIAQNTYEHYQDHIDDLKRWMEM
jgi:arsenate reductase-like glutaredoxin family protein